MSRRSARKQAFYLLFQMDFHQIEEYDAVKGIFFQETEEDITQADKDFILEEADGAIRRLPDIDAQIQSYAKGWDMDRISKVDLAILRLAVYELFYGEDTPVSVAINEAVELAKKFSSDEAPAFINGILGSIAVKKQTE